MSAGGVQDITNWLIDGARSAERSDLVLEELCKRVVEAGIPLWRVGVFVRTLHPDVFGRSFIWRPGTQVITAEARFDIVESDQYRTSPLFTLFTNGGTVRCRVCDGDGVADSKFLRELRDEGGTDYIAIPLVFTDGSVHAASFSTKQAGGFTAIQVAALQALVPPLARVAEIRALRRTAVNLLETYVGNRAGERILAGQIRRGHADTIDAAIWLSDMRGFTSLSDRHPPERVVQVLNQYFDCQVPAIVKHGGEVLKFMGDGLLAIFPIAKENAARDDVCTRVLTAARETRAAVDAVNASQGRWATDRLRFGLALHLGQVLYGNIGGGNRLDFTCIGPAVNLAARIEKLAGKLGRTVVASAEFARHAEPEWEHIGEFSVAGFAAAQTVYGLRDESAPPATAAPEVTAAQA